MPELLSSCCETLQESSRKEVSTEQEANIIGNKWVLSLVPSSKVTDVVLHPSKCKPALKKIVCRQSKEEHDAHVAALGKEDKEMEEVFDILELNFMLTSLVLHLGAGAQFGRAQAAGCRQAEPGAAPRKPLQEHQPWGTHRSGWTKRSLMVLLFAERVEFYHFRVKKGRQP